ncbi:MAG: gliding motility-associated C-terminal domain-containing protein, partial [Cyclobacteriaceae bacterium]|nr:gliding motility-associated C-terminal domain-containing protein [Cyclobacteriaceae bacterium]
GNYYIQAQDDFSKCYSTPFQVTINDVSKDPIINIVQESPDYACVGGTHTGILAPTLFGGSDNDPAFANFTINWYLQGTLIPPATDNGGGTFADKAIDLAPGDYTIEVTDNSNLDEFCITSRDFTVTAARHDIDITASSLDQTRCIPDGSAQIETIAEDGVGIALPDPGWFVSLLDENKNDITPGGVTGYTVDPFINLSAGNYYIQAQDDFSKCYSTPFQVTINDISENPVIAIDIITPQYSLNPNSASWTGTMLATVTESSTGLPEAGGYAYSWHVGMDDGNPSLSGLDNVSALDEEYYTFIAVNNTTGCESRYYQYLPFVYLEPTFNTSITPKTICSPNDGGIEVTDIALDGTPDMLSDYTFNWHHDIYNEGDTPDAIIPGNDVRTAYDNINSGSYYIISRENWWMIESYPVKVEVIDSTTNPIITFDGTNYQPLTSCDESVFSNGALAVEVYEDLNNPNVTPPFNYSYAWYAGDNVNAANVITDSINNSISGLPSGEFTILVTNLGNNCEGEKTFTIEDKSITPIAIPMMTPVTNCPIEIANGIVTAQVINSNENFEFLWYAGTDTKATPDFAGDTWYGKTLGYYTVIAVDEEFGTCISEPVLIEVMDATVNPNIIISEIHPITNCDPERPNAIVSASADGGISGYTFDWYEDGQLYYSGPLASDLGNSIYELIVTNNVTQCSSSKDVIPSVLFDEVAPPNVDIISDRTSCLNPDGQATATIEGNVKDYIFRYYRKHDNSSVDNFFIDNVIYDLDTSTYLVTAENRITGCISNPTEFVISNDSYFPEIDVITNPSNCQDPSGDATVIISDMTRDFKVTWYSDNGFEAQEKELVYIPVGKYMVEVEGTDGCVSSAEAVVKGDVIIYNGVSVNYDGLNDFFQIVCLEYFPDNNVKIYNRAGLLVYEKEFYDMNDPSRRFEGISNKGASVIGSELPIGTYFYVVDKNDGSKAKVGYLELNR